MSTTQRVVLYTYEGHEDLTYPDGHPFRPERSRLLMDILDREGFLVHPWVAQRSAPPAQFEEMARFHEEDYLNLLVQAGRGEHSLEMLAYGIGSQDCPVFPGLFELASLACGATLSGVRALTDEQIDLAFNPIGGFHHAGPSYAEGFCYVNDLVLGCQDLAGRGKRVASVDLDVHHGNGTEDAFIDNPEVLTISTHESGKTLYPWGGFETSMGVDRGLGYNVNIPLPAGTDDDLYLRAFNQVVMPILKAYSPDVIALEIGMDVLNGDPLGHLRMTNNGIADAVAEIRSLGRPLLVLGGGGYHAANTARGWALALTVLCGVEPMDDYAGLVGGVFLGSGERSGGLRDMRIYNHGPEREDLQREIDRVIEFHQVHTFPIHGL